MIHTSYVIPMPNYKRRCLCVCVCHVLSCPVIITMNQPVQCSDTELNI